MLLTTFEINTIGLNHTLSIVMNSLLLQSIIKMKTQSKSHLLLMINWTYIIIWWICRNQYLLSALLHLLYFLYGKHFNFLFWRSTKIIKLSKFNNMKKVNRLTKKKIKSLITSSTRELDLICFQVSFLCIIFHNGF